MKHIFALILLLAMLLFAGALALAESGPVARNGEFAAYIDGDGRLFLPGRTEPINASAANGVVSIDAYRVLFLSPDNFLGSNDLYAVNLESFQEAIVARDVYDACLADGDTLWYVSNANRNQLMRVSLPDITAEVAYTSEEPIDRLYLSIEGLIVRQVDQAGALLYVKDTGSFETYTQPVPRSGMLTDSSELYLTDEGELYLRSGYSYASELIDSDVTAFAYMNGTAYYLSRTGNAVQLRSYELNTKARKNVLTPAVSMADQLTASDNRLFMLTADRSVCRVDLAEGKLSILKRYQDLAPYSLPADKQTSGLRIEAMSGQLNVYAELEDANAKPDFSFIDFSSDADVAVPELKLIDTHALKAEENAWDLFEPTPQYQTLVRGSRGDAVRAIQQPLKDLGYYDYYVDGIYGPRTEAAVRLLQLDLGKNATGAADAELQRLILSGKLGAYDPYVTLKRGSRGYRVRLMQERLRALGYLADNADGIFGPRTQKAVQLFQSENGLKVSEAATKATLERLYSDAAARCSSYIDLYPGDSGCRVRELNNRLKELYYLDSNPGSSYTSATTSAVRVFQRTAGLRETGQATIPVLRALFASDAPEAPGYIVLRRGDSGERVERLQRRLADLHYYHGRIDGYFGRETQEAVRLFQRKVGLKATGEATVRTQQLLFSADAPEYVRPTVIGVPEITLDTYDKYIKGVYYIYDDDMLGDYVNFYWYAEGDVDYYNVRITDEYGDVYVDNDTQMTRTGVSLATLDPDVVYTLRITAYPEDGNRKHITSAEIRFARVEPYVETTETIVVGIVGKPTISIETVARHENGVYYIMPGTVTLRWFAEGDVDSYHVEILDESDDELFGEDTDELSVELDTDSLNPGELYTAYVYAIPENGDLGDAPFRSLRFMLPENELPEAEPVEIPTSPTDSELVTEVYKLQDEDVPEDEDEDDLETIELLPTDEDEGEAPEGVESTGEDEDEAAESVESTPGEGTGSESVDTLETETIDEAESETGYTDEDVPGDEAEPETPDDEEAEPQASVTAPVISFDPVAAVTDGVCYLSKGNVTIRWSSEGNVSQYRLVFTDDSGAVVGSTTTDKTSIPGNTDALDAQTIYTLTVTAIPADGDAENAPSGSARFGVYADDSGEAQAPSDPETEPEGEPEPEQLQEPEDEPEPEQPQEHETEGEGSQPPASVSAPDISFDSVASFEDGVYRISGNLVTMRWHSDGDVASYYVQVFDSNNALLADNTTTENELSAPSASLDSSQVYKLVVTAIPQGGDLSDGATGDAYFTVYSAPAGDPESGSEGDSVPVEEYREEATPEEERPASTDEYREEDYQKEDSMPIEDYDQGDSMPIEDYGEKDDNTPTDEYPFDGEAWNDEESSSGFSADLGSLSAPQITFGEYDAFENETYYLSSQVITLSWDWNNVANSYHVELRDEYSTVLATMDTEDAYLTITADELQRGCVYIVNVTAIPSGGTLNDGVTGTARFMLTGQTDGDVYLLDEDGDYGGEGDYDGDVDYGGDDNYGDYGGDDDYGDYGGDVDYGGDDDY